MNPTTLSELKEYGEENITIQVELSFKTILQ